MDILPSMYGCKNKQQSNHMDIFNMPVHGSMVINTAECAQY